MNIADNPDDENENGYIYILTSPYKKTIPRRKIGLTTLPHHRLHTYMTSCCDVDELYFEKLYRVRVSGVEELRDIEGKLHAHFDTLRRRREWFELDSPDPVDEFIRNHASFSKECTLNDVKDLQYSKESVKREKRLVKQQQEQQEQQDPLPVHVPVLIPDKKDLITEYFSHMLPPGSTLPRRIQSELFCAFLEKTSENEKYKGIVQWPTAVGKTIGMLSLLFISFSRRSSEGKIWRGLLIAPQNDILNTIMDSIKRLEKWGITIISGHDAQFVDALQEYPRDRHCLIITTHASLTDRRKWEMLPDIDHCHYDEVHQSTGMQFFGLLVEWIPKFTYFTGTSATPKTCNSEQHTRLHQLFGNPLEVLHQCEMDEAVKEGWIAQPKIIAKIVDSVTRIQDFIVIVAQSVAKKREQGKWVYGKVIVYLDTIADVQTAVRCAIQYFNEATIYMAVKDTSAANANAGASTELDVVPIEGAHPDSEFIKDEADGSLRILFACQRYRQGSDIKGIEMTMVLFNSTIATNVFVQIMGRALRRDYAYANKEGWCVIVKTRSEGEEETSEDVMDSILLEMASFLILSSTSDADNKKPKKQQLQDFVSQFLEFDVDRKEFSIEETVERMQCMYLRKEYVSGNKGVREYCIDKGIDSSFEYAEHRKTETRISLPTDLPCQSNETVYAFLHPNASCMQKSEFINLLKTLDLTTSQKYETWRTGLVWPSAYPSIQHISDGYFGPNDTNFNTFVESKRSSRR
jgi:superfamily II DNA or RNA helicase